MFWAVAVAYLAMNAAADCLPGSEGCTDQETAAMIVSILQKRDVKAHGAENEHAKELEARKAAIIGEHEDLEIEIGAMHAEEQTALLQANATDESKQNQQQQDLQQLQEQQMQTREGSAEIVKVGESSSDQQNLTGCKCSGAHSSSSICDSEKNEHDCKWWSSCKWTCYSSPVLTSDEREQLYNAMWATPCPDNYVPGDEGEPVSGREYGSGWDCTQKCLRASDCSQFAFYNLNGQSWCYLKKSRYGGRAETGCPNRIRKEGYTWVAHLN